MKLLLIMLLLSYQATAATTTARNLNEIDALNSIARQTQADISFGNIPSRQGWTAFGRDLDVDTGTAQVVRSSGGTAEPVRTAASTISIVSSSAADDVGGTGATSLIIYGIDANYLEVLEIINLDGTTPVTTTNQLRAINRVAVYNSGTGRRNAGTITFTHVTDSAAIWEIPIGISVTESSVYTVPANKIAFISSLVLNGAKPTSGADPEMVFRVKVYSPFTNTVYEIGHSAFSSTTNHDNFENFKMEPLAARETVWIEVSTSVNNSVASTRMNLILADFP